MSTTYRRSLQMDVIVNGVLPDNEPKNHPIIEFDEIAQAPTDFDVDDLRSRRDVNIEWAARLYAHKFGLGPDDAERMVALLHSTRDMLGPDASPTMMFRAMRDVLASRPSRNEDAMLRDAWDQACTAWRNGVIISA